jgi:hypothetical protein
VLILCLLRVLDMESAQAVLASVAGWRAYLRA